MPNYVIITADDYGMCESVNQAIEACLEAGAMRATCVMTNMPLWRETARLRQRFPQASIGLHWTLTLVTPVLPAEAVPSLVDQQGHFFSFAQLRQKIMRREVKVAEIEAELTAQFVRFRDTAGMPDFWNTHENIHVTPGLFGVCVDLGQKLGIKAMRCQRRVTIPKSGSALMFNLRHPFYWLKGVVIDRWSSAAERRGMHMPDGAIHTPGFRDGDSDIADALRRAPWRHVRRAAELIIHPATRLEPELFGNLTESRLRDYRVFSDPALKDRLIAAGMQPAGFEVLYGR
ncbi:MAG: ChbG/HpnK family deacetylase [Roseiflexaceae bacterium]